MSECDYEGCNEPALEGSDKCIFHKPNKNEEEARKFYKMIRQEAREPEGEVVEDEEGEEHRRWVFGGKINWEYYHFPKIPEASCLFTLKGVKFTGKAILLNTKFDEVAHFTQAEFGGDVYFSGAKFGGGADFMWATFGENAGFHEAEFGGDVYFNEAEFGGNAGFHGTLFEGGADFNEALFHDNADLDKALFCEGAGFNEAEFRENAGFMWVAFSGDADFKRAQFGGGAAFHEAKFHENADLRGAQFSGDADFKRAQFGGGAAFHEALFEGDVYFNEALFEGDVYFNEALFEGDADFESATFEGDADFSDVKFFEDCSFITSVFYAGLVLQNYHFEHRPQFISDLDELDYGVEKKEDNISDSIDLLRSTSFSIVQIVIKPEENSEVVFRERGDAIERLEELPEIKGMTLYIEKFVQSQAKAAGCREQRLTYESKGKKEETDQVYVHEMRARRETKNSQLQRFIDWFVADWTCEYGTRWQTVLWRSVEITGLSGILFWLANIVSKTLPAAEPWIGTITGPNVEQLITLTPFGVIRGLGNSLYYSAITFTTLGYGDLHPTGLMMKTLSGIESAVGALFAALIIVVFSRKWMRS